MYKSRKGITLIALVVTIIVLLILAGISIMMITGQNGILTRAGDAGDSTKYSNYKEQVDMYFQGRIIEEMNNGTESTESSETKKLKEYFQKGPETFWDNNTGRYANIEPITDAATTLSTVTGGSDYVIIAYMGNKYKVVYTQTPEWNVISVTSEVPSSNSQNSSAFTTIKDKAEIKKIIPDITDDDLEKVSIQKGKLVYDPEKVNDNEKTLMESVGILAMVVGATIIFIANGQEFARLQADKIRFPENIPTKENYVFHGWYYDEEGLYPYNNAPVGYQSVNYETGEPTYNYVDWDRHEQNKANEDDEIEGSEITLYATFRGTSNFNTCLVEGTKITLANGLKKNIEDITYNDELLVWNFDEGKIDSSVPIWIMKKKVNKKYIQFKFDNGAELKLTIHRVFNVDKQIFANADMDEEIDVGTSVFLEDGTIAKVIRKEEIEKEVNVYNVITNKHINLFAEGILTSMRFNEIYEIKEMKFVKENRELNKKEDYPNIPEKYFEGLRLAEQKNTLLDSGKLWWEERVLDVIMKNEKTN